MGRTALVDNEDKFRALQELGLNGITLDGVQGSRRGVLRGGHRLQGASLLDLYDEYSQAKDNLEQAMSDVAEGTEANLEAAARHRERLMRNAQAVKTRLERTDTSLSTAR